MDENSEKKWFIYIQDQHEGPFSLIDIQDQLQGGRITRESFVWKEGMTDWKLMSEFSEFVAPTSEFAPSLILEPEEVKATPPAEFHISEKYVESIIPSPSVDTTLGDPTQDTQMPRQSRFWSRSLMFLTLVLIGIGGYGMYESPLQAEKVRSALVQLSHRFSAFSWINRWISPLPFLTDVESSDFLELKRIAQLNRDTGLQVSFAAAVSESGDGTSPIFYLVTNVDESIPLHFYLIGNPETLLNQTHFYLDMAMSVDQRLAKTSVLRGSDGHPLPRGEYFVFVGATESRPGLPQFVTETNLPDPLPIQLPKDVKILAFRKMFLGGPKDNIYASRLKDYHDKLQAKSLLELAEVKQFAATVESQLNSTETKYNLLRRGAKLALTKKQWDAFHGTWGKLELELAREFQKWTPEGISQNVYHGALYLLLQQAGAAVDRVHERHHSFFVGVQDPKTFEIQLGALTAAARSALNVLRSKVEHIEKLGTTPNGMPRKDDL